MTCFPAVQASQVEAEEACWSCEKAPYLNLPTPTPPAAGFASSRLRSHGRKDTLVNILETG